MLEAELPGLTDIVELNTIAVALITDEALAIP